MSERKPKNLASVITINTDASYDPKTKTGGFGVWIKSDFFTIKQAGKFKGEITDSNEAEIKAIVNALKILRSNLSANNRSIQMFDTLVINCDNAVARGIINQKKVSQRFTVEGSMLLDLTSGFKKVYAKHINGHKASTNARQFVNNWCDQASKKYRAELAK
jgi:ribonuclease HI